MGKGLVALSKSELETCFGGYAFTCPKNKTELQKKVAKYLKESQDKANAYVKYCYEECGFN